MTSLPEFQKRRFFHVVFAVLAKHLVMRGTKTCHKKELNYGHLAMEEKHETYIPQKRLLVGIWLSIPCHKKICRSEPSRHALRVCRITFSMAWYGGSCVYRENTRDSLSSMVYH